jgi:hypothetical protein
MGMRSVRPIRWLTLFLVMGLSASAAAGELRFASGSGRNVMVELFTSEGCNSCPPAEAFLNDFQSHPDLWRRYVPIAFHVDYWDYLGWTDRYADPRHAERQRRYARQGGVRTVYTPAFIINGRAWGVSGPRAALPVGGAPAGVLEVRVREKAFEAAFTPAEQNSDAAELNLAVLGMGLTTDIRAGENEGRQAAHEFVVLAHTNFAGRSNHWRGSVPAVRDTHGTKRLALVAWVSRPGDPTPLQATGGYLP